jgi:hypothetical protein
MGKWCNRIQQFGSEYMIMQTSMHFILVYVVI